ncbi:unnamed protein product [Caenorhabditis angaria]|uniref:Large ribosomal subunit protein mL62 n=1 Tax=Caenorhabditis angaria TaxID=860376 RepID=A0A9P1IJD6_9PELO|nr:unnamed protein product [Caenorhabditis angaria]
MLRSRLLIQHLQLARSSTFNGIIPTDKIEKRFSLSSGPGGQNVNKNATKVEIRFKLGEATWLDDTLKDSISEKLAHRINSAGELIIDSDRTRHRHLNVADCFDKLRSEIYAIQEDQGKRTISEKDEKILRDRQILSNQRRLAEKRKLAEKREFRGAVEL